MEIKAKSKKLVDLRQYLETERERLRGEIARGQLTTGEERSGYSTHMADDATAVFEQERNVGMQRAQECMLAAVEDALTRMVDGTYGRCKSCGDAIDLARLKAMPTASYCLGCQEHHEENGHWRI